MGSRKIIIEVAVENDINTRTAIFDRKISFEGNIDEQKANRLLKIAEACPIHKLLEGDIKVKTSII